MQLRFQGMGSRARQARIEVGVDKLQQFSWSRVGPGLAEFLQSGANLIQTRMPMLQIHPQQRMRGIVLLAMGRMQSHILQVQQPLQGPGG